MHSFDFSVDKEVGIQLTERQLQMRQRRRDAQQTRRPFETQSNRVQAPAVAVDDDNKATTNFAGDTIKPRSVASTTVARADQKDFLRRVLASKKQSTAQSSISDHQKSYLRHMLASSRQEQAEETESVASSAASSTAVDQKALLRKVLLSKTTTASSKVNQENVQTRETENHATEMRPLQRNSTDDKEQEIAVKPFQYRSVVSNGVRHGREDRGEEETSHQSSDASHSALPLRSMATSTVSSGYIEFLDALKREVAGDHTEVRVPIAQVIHVGMHDFDTVTCTGTYSRVVTALLLRSCGKVSNFCFTIMSRLLRKSQSDASLIQRPRKC